MKRQELAKLLKRFERVIERSPQAPIEFAWSLKTDTEGLKKILTLKNKPNDSQLNEIRRIVGKANPTT